MTKWHSGPPPSLGWWPCSFRGRGGFNYLRWWDGQRWSWAARPTDSAADAAQTAREPSYYTTSEIQWSDRPADWPERSKT